MGSTRRTAVIGAVAIGIATASLFSPVSPAGAHPAASMSPTSSWGKSVAVDPAAGNATDASCLSSSFCAVVDATGSAVVGGGKRWQRAIAVDPGSALDAVSCATEAFCVAAGVSGSFFVYNGARWSLQQAVPAAAGVASLSCVSTSFCLAVTSGTARVFGFDGNRWTRQAAIPGTNGPLVTVSCATYDWCGVGDSHGRVAIFDASGWQAWHQDSGEPDAPAYVQCPVATWCMGVAGGDSMIDQSGNWTSIAVGNSKTKELTCASTTMCAMAGLGKVIELFDGTSWRAIHAHQAYEQLFALSCAAPGWCLVVYLGGEGQEWDGTRWTAPIAVDLNAGGGGALTCPAVGFCELTDSWGNVMERTQQGWTAPKMLLYEAYFVGTICGTATFCLTLLSDSFYPNDVFVWDGQRWRDSAPNPVLNNPQSGACAPRTTFCMAFSNIAGATTTDGVNWTQIGVPTNGAFDVSCASATFCMTIGSGDTSSTWNGSTFGAPQAIGGGSAVVSLSCPASDFCLAGLEDGQVVTYDGTSWSAPTQLFPTDPAFVSCPTTTFCAAADLDGTESTWHGASWSTPIVIDTAQLSSVSCATPHYCAVADFDGNVITSRTP